MTRPRSRRFVIVTWSFAPGGTYSVLRTWIPRLRRHGTVMGLSHGPDGLDPGIPVVHAGSRRSHPLRFPGVLIYLLRMTRAARRLGGDDVVLIAQDSLATGAAAVLAARVSGATSVVMEHGTAEAIRSRYFWRERWGPSGRAGRLRQPILEGCVRLLHRVALRGARLALLAGDEAEAVYRASGVPAERILRFHFAVDVERFHPAGASERAAAREQLGLPQDRLVLLSVSRLAPEKGLDDLLSAAASSHGTPLVVLAGEGRERTALETLAATLRVEARFAGEQDPAGVARLLRAADIFVYAGRQGANTPYAVLEAMAGGLAVIATTAPAVHAVMLADGRGIAVPPGDRMGMTAAVDALAADPTLRSSMGVAARAYVERFHSPATLDAEVDAFVTRIESIQAGNSRP